MAKDKAGLGDEYMSAWKRNALTGWSWVGDALEDYIVSGAKLSGLTIRPSRDGDGSVLVVLRGNLEDGTPVVAFSNGSTALDAILAAKARAENSGIKWREDQPWPGK